MNSMLDLVEELHNILNTDDIGKVGKELSSWASKIPSPLVIIKFGEDGTIKIITSFLVLDTAAKSEMEKKMVLLLAEKLTKGMFEYIDLAKA